MASYDSKYDPLVREYLAGGGTQGNVDAYFAGNPDVAQVQRDAGGYFGAEGAGEAGGNTPRVIAQQRLDQAQFGPGSGTIYDPWEQTVTRDRNGNLLPGFGAGASTPLTLPGGRTVQRPGADVRFAGGQAPVAGAPVTMAPAGSAAGYGGLGSLAGGTGGSAASGNGGYSLPNSAAASQSLRDLQMGGATGLQALMTRDTTAARKALEDALYAGQEEGINSAADRSRQAMLEGTFGRGVGSSSILVELAGRGEQERGDALARARREAFTQAGSEDRADFASQLGLNQAAFGAGTTGLQGEANVMLANLAREQAASQFAQNLGFQGSENAANRAQQASQFSGNQALSYAQLGQQASQFGANQAFVGAENAANRAQSTQEAELNRQLQQLILESQQTFAGGQNQASRDATAALQASSQGFQGGQNQAARDAAAAAQASSQGFAGAQNQLSREQQNQNLLLQLANSQDIAEGNRLASGIGAAGTGAGALLGPWLAQYIKDLGA